MMKINGVSLKYCEYADYSNDSDCLSVSDGALSYMVDGRIKLIQSKPNQNQT